MINGRRCPLFEFLDLGAHHAPTIITSVNSACATEVLFPRFTARSIELIHLLSTHLLSISPTINTKPGRSCSNICRLRRLNCENYSEDLFRFAVEGVKQIHDAFVHHHDIYPRICLFVSGTRVVWDNIQQLARRHIAIMKPNLSKVLESFWFL